MKKVLLAMLFAACTGFSFGVGFYGLMWAALLVETGRNIFK